MDRSTCAVYFWTFGLIFQAAVLSASGLPPSYRHLKLWPCTRTATSRPGFYFQLTFRSYLKNGSISRFLLQSFDEGPFLLGGGLRQSCLDNVAENRNPISVTPIYAPVGTHLIAPYGSVPSRLIRLAGGKGWDFDIGPGRYRQPEGHGSSPKTRCFMLNVLDVEVAHLNDVKQCADATVLYQRSWSRYISGSR
jgi:hypothetical protein